MAKFHARLTPHDDSKMLYFIGQDNDSIMQYMDHFHRDGKNRHRPPMPGLTAYTAFCDDRDKSLAGLSPGIPDSICPVTCGAGPVNLSTLLNIFPEAPLNIGLEMTSANLCDIGEGWFTETIDKFADWLQGPEVGHRAVLLRIGYEFVSAFFPPPAKRAQGGGSQRILFAKFSSSLYLYLQSKCLVPSYVLPPMFFGCFPRLRQTYRMALGTSMNHAATRTPFGVLPRS